MPITYVNLTCKTANLFGLELLSQATQKQNNTYCRARHFPWKLRRPTTKAWQHILPIQTPKRKAKKANFEMETLGQPIRRQPERTRHARPAEEEKRGSDQDRQAPYCRRGQKRKDWSDLSEEENLEPTKEPVKAKLLFQS